MADLTITATSVVGGSGTKAVHTGGATITAGQVLYQDTADSNKVKLGDANASATTATFFGIALNGGASGQPIYVQKDGEINVGATLTVGTIYVLSATAGGIAPVDDLATGWRTTIIGVGLTSSNMKIIGYSSGVAVP